MVFLLLSAMATTGAAQATSAPVATAQHAPRTAPPTLMAKDGGAEAAHYQRAELQNPELQEFEGGSTIVIAGSTTAIVLAIVLLVILL